MCMHTRRLSHERDRERERERYNNNTNMGEECPVCENDRKLTESELISTSGEQLLTSVARCNQILGRNVHLSMRKYCKP